MENEISLTSRFESAISLISHVKNFTVTSRHEHEALGDSIAKIREIEKRLDSEYESLEVVQIARRLSKEKNKLSRDLEEARKAAKARLIRFEDILEAERLKEERQAQQDSIRLAEDATLQAAADEEKLGNKEMAEAILAEPVAPVTVVVPVEQLKAKGHTRRRVWKSKIVDPSKIPAEYMAPDLDKISATVRAWKRDGEVIPGVMAWSEVV